MVPPCLDENLVSPVEKPPPLRTAAFEADVTPPLGSPLSLGNRPPAKRIVDRLTARGLVLLGDGPALVLYKRGLS